MLWYCIIGGPGMYSPPIATSSISMARPIPSNLSHTSTSSHDNGNASSVNTSSSITAATATVAVASSRVLSTRTPRLTSVRPATALPLDPFGNSYYHINHHTIYHIYILYYLYHIYCAVLCCVVVLILISSGP